METNDKLSLSKSALSEIQKRHFHEVVDYAKLYREGEWFYGGGYGPIEFEANARFDHAK